MPNAEDMNQEQHMRHEQRFAKIDVEIAGVKADVKTLAAGQVALQSSQDRGFSELKEAISNRDNQPPKIGVGLLITLLGFILSIGAIAVTAFWASVLLLFNPLKEQVNKADEAQSSHWQFHRHENAGERISLVEEKSERNKHEIMEEATARKKSDGEIWRRLEKFEDNFYANVSSDSYKHGVYDTMSEWQRDDDEALKEDLHRHIKEHHIDE